MDNNYSDPKASLREKVIKVSSLVLLDIIFMNLSVFLSLLVRFELKLSGIDPEYIRAFLLYIPIFTVCTLLSFKLFKLYNSLWHFAGVMEGCLIIGATATASVFHILGSTLLDLRLPLSCYIMTAFFSCAFTVSIRYMYRIIRTIKARGSMILPFRMNKDISRIMIIGAGEAGLMLIKEIASSRYLKSRKVVCIIDDNAAKVGSQMYGINIVGTRKDIPWAVDRYQVDEIILAIPSASTKEKTEILGLCSQTNCELKTLPGIYQIVGGDVNVSKIRKVEIDDLLGREPVIVDMENIFNYIQNKTVMVTGGGGSIGSELCRQLADHHPKCLIIFEIYENNAYDIQNELKAKYPDLNLVVLMGSVRDEDRIDQVFKAYHPEIIYHAAAHKHVPLMEDSPNEAVKNNVFGTFNVVKAADKYHADRFVMISTDKAVNPTNVMGATKRICEMIIQTYNKRSETEFVAVRFGNVLGSNGSVIPLFKKQIKEGGPVTVTHPDIVRYFMTIPEAVSLVLQAGVFAKGGEIFVLDMGKSMKILTLAENLIRLSGFTPYEDIQIKFTGLRPGEKLFEELLMDEEGLMKTTNNRIYIGHPINIDEDDFLHNLQVLHDIMADDSSDIRRVINKIVPTCKFKDSESKDKTFELDMKNESKVING